MDCRTKLEKFLRDQGVELEIQEHTQAFTAQEVAASEHIHGRAMAKVVMVKAEGGLVMLVVPAPSMVDLDKVARAIRGPVRLAEEPEFTAVFGDCQPGAMPPFGSLYEVPVLVDRTMIQSPSIVFQAGTHTVTMTVPSADFERLVQPKVDDIIVV